MAKDPERRPMMSAVVQELEQCLLELPVEEETVVLPARPPARRARRPLELAAPHGARAGSRSARRSASICSCTGRAAVAAGGGRHGGRAPARAVGVRPATGRTERTTPPRRGRPTAIPPPSGRPRPTADAPSLDKSGVGLVLDAGKTVPLHRITVRHEHAGLQGRDQGRVDAATPFPDIVSGTQTVGTSTRFRPDRGLAPVLPALDHEARPPLPLRPRSSRSDGSRLVRAAAAALEALDGQVGQLLEQAP